MLRSLDSDYLEQNSMCPLLASSGSVPDIGCVELVVGVGQSTCMGRLVSRRIVKEPISLFDRTTSPRPDLFFARAAARSDRQGWAEGPSRSDLPLTVTSTAADLLDRGRSFFALQCWATENTEGELAIVRAACAPQTCIRPTREDRKPRCSHAHRRRSSEAMGSF
jgi:hypothetical protein